MPLQPFDNGPAIRADGFSYHANAILRGDLNSQGLGNNTYAFRETRPGYWRNSNPPEVALTGMP